MPKWRNPAMPSVVSQSDAIVKQAKVFPWLAESAVSLEQLGYSESQIERIKSDKRRFDASQTLEAMSGAQT